MITRLLRRSAYVLGALALAGVAAGTGPLGIGTGSLAPLC